MGEESRGACDLATRKCVPCEGGMPPLTAEQAKELLGKVNAWQLSDAKEISKEFRFKNFRQAMAFVNKVAEVAEGEGHHPDIYIFYNRVRFSLSTHAIGGLSENDFILAAKIDLLA